MSEQQVKEFLKRLKKRSEKVLKSREESIKLLQRAGICNSKGELTELYKNSDS